MSHRYKVVFLALSAIAILASVSVPAGGMPTAVVAPELSGPALSTSGVLIEKDWCDDKCDRQCPTCQTAFTQGCSCYWYCTDGTDGETLCGAARLSVKICS